MIATPLDVHATHLRLGYRSANCEHCRPDPEVGARLHQPTLPSAAGRAPSPAPRGDGGPSYPEAGQR